MTDNISAAVAAALDGMGARAARAVLAGQGGFMAALKRVSDEPYRCEEILVLEDGLIVDRGTHDELIARDGLYARFAEEQRIESELERLGEADLPVAEEAR